MAEDHPGNNPGAFGFAEDYSAGREKDSRAVL
jgi:hypothetical protein